MTSRHRRGEDAQATAELALLLPIIFMIVLAVGQVVLVWRAQILVTQAAREAARTGVVTADVSAIATAAAQATGLDAERLDVVVVTRGAPGSVITVRVSYHPVDQLPIVGAAVGGLTVSATATMLVES
jgi:hypothetical protein